MKKGFERKGPEQGDDVPEVEIKSKEPSLESLKFLEFIRSMAADARFERQGPEQGYNVPAAKTQIEKSPPEFQFIRSMAEEARARGDGETFLECMAMIEPEKYREPCNRARYHSGQPLMELSNDEDDQDIVGEASAADHGE